MSKRIWLRQPHPQSRPHPPPLRARHLHHRPPDPRRHRRPAGSRPSHPLRLLHGGYWLAGSNQEAEPYLSEIDSRIVRLSAKRRGILSGLIRTYGPPTLF